MSSWNRWKGIMKCHPFEEKRLAKWQPPYIVQPKYDGVRCRAIPTENGHLLVSSEENPIFSVPHINKSLLNINCNAELDGELYCHGMSFEEIVSITSRTVNLHPNHKSIKFHIFDIVNELDQLHRTLNIKKLEGIDPNLSIAPFWVCETLDSIMKVYDKLINQGYEGIIVRNIYAGYERKRSTWVMKFKPKKSDCYKIIGSIEEVSKDGNPKGRLGALVCDSGDGTTFNVGTGFNDSDREDLWNCRDEIVGSFVLVEYQHLTSGKKVPRFPVYSSIIKEC